MIDQNKRKTLKTLAVGTGAVVGGSLMMGATALASSASTEAVKTISLEELELGHIEVYPRVSVENNDIEVVLTNAGRQPVLITQMTPRSLNVARGEFDFSALLKDGPLPMKAGESVTIPLKRKTLNYSVRTSSVASLDEALKRNLSIVTEDDSFASVSVVRNALIA